MIRLGSSAFVLVLAAGCSGGGAGDAGAPPDVYLCTQEDFDRSTPVEEELTGLPASELRRARGWDRFASEDLVEGVGLSDGSLVAAMNTSVFRLVTDGTITFIGEGRDFAYVAADDRQVLRASDGERDSPAFRLELYPYDRPGPIGPSYPVELPSTPCNAMQSYTPHISAGRYLVLRSNCEPVPNRRTVAERWALADRLERVTGPFEIMPPQLTAYGADINAHADGLGGVFWAGQRNTEAGWEVVAGHWDGDALPTFTEPIVPTGATTEYLLGRPYPDGRYLIATNHPVDGGLHTTVALVGLNATSGAAEIVWRWESSGIYYSGPFVPALDVVGEGDVLVLLVQHNIGTAVFVQRLDPEGRSRWSEPREVYRDDANLRLLGYDGGVALTGHADGSAHLLWADQTGRVSMTRTDSEGRASWPAPVRVGLSPHLSGKAISDGLGGVWVLINDRSGTVQHFTADGWRLYRRWFVPGCGRVRGFFARTAPDAEPVTYFGSDPLFGP